MTNSITASDLINNFCDKLRQIELNKYLNRNGKQPEYPMLFFCLGDAAIQGWRFIAEKLFRIWPPYQDILKFIGVRLNDKLNNHELFELTLNGDKIISEDDLLGIITELLKSGKNIFNNKFTMCVYYLLDSTGFADAADFAVWQKVIQWLSSSELVGKAHYTIIDMLILLLNESLSKKNIADSIRDQLENYHKDENKFCKSIFLLSNNLEDNSMLQDWETAYHIIALAVVLSNNADAQLSGPMFHGEILTAGYSCVEKPMQNIGQIIVDNLLNRLAALISQEVAQNLNMDVLGLNLQKIMLDSISQYIDSISLPSANERELFPRASMDTKSLSRLNDDEFDQATMGAWTAYLKQIAQNVKNKNWCAEWRKQFDKVISLNELEFIDKNIAEVKDNLYNLLINNGNSIGTSDKAKLQKLFLQENILWDTFFYVLAEQCQQARQAIECRDRLLSSRGRLLPVKDNTIINFYNRIMTNYFDANNEDIKNRFLTIHTVESLLEFLDKQLLAIINNDSIFTQPFEEELQARLPQGQNANVVQMDILKRLTGTSSNNQIPVYLQVNFNLGVPIVSTIFLAFGTGLDKTLQQNLLETVSYYDTGYGNAAEAISIYKVSKNNLRRGNVNVQEEKNDL